MDLALAYAVQQRLAAKGTKLDAWQLRGLSQNCRAAKETLLQAEAPKSQPLAILGRGSSVIGGTIRTELAYAELETTLVDGFFRVVSRRSPEVVSVLGFEMGLPYAPILASRVISQNFSRQRTGSWLLVVASLQFSLMAV
jgi:hypothetical protein